LHSSKKKIFWPSCNIIRQKMQRPIDAATRRSFHDIKAVEYKKGDGQNDGNSTSRTLSTASFTSDESSCFDAEESKNDCSDKCSTPTSPVHVEFDADEDDGYETDQAVCDSDTMASTHYLHKLSLDKQIEQEVQHTVEQILHEQTIALEAWDEVASEYHRRIEPFTLLFVPNLLDPKFLVPSSSRDECHYLAGKSVLDVAAGTGAAAMYAASRGASSVMATDFSSNMLEVLQRMCTGYSYHDIETTLANGMCLPLRWNNSYDIVTSNFGVIYFPKVKEGIMEMIRCAKPGGKVCLSGWGSRAETRAFGIFPAAIKRCRLDRKWYRAQCVARKQMLALSCMEPPMTDDHCQRKRKPSLTPNFFCPAKRISSSQCYLRSIMIEAGLESVKVIPVTNVLELSSIESYWERFVLASPNFKRFVDRCLSPEEVIQLKDAVVEILLEENEVASRCCEDGVALSSSAYMAFGTKRNTLAKIGINLD
jgi:2-polyprenyl-3-methyl-5-hydroxy-6-metoxy-1,4-benzoquinol methylase